MSWLRFKYYAFQNVAADDWNIFVFSEFDNKALKCMDLTCPTTDYAAVSAVIKLFKSCQTIRMVHLNPCTSQSLDFNPIRHLWYVVKLMKHISHFSRQMCSNRVNQFSAATMYLFCKCYILKYKNSDF